MHRILTVITSLLLCTAGFAQPRPDFSTDHAGGCSPLIVHFTPTGTTGPYSWDLGNGNTSTIASPEAIYTDPGTYTVTLTVNGQSATHTVTVYTVPTISFAAASPKVCGTPVTYTGNTDGGNGSFISSWLWDYGDGSTQTSYSASTSHLYAQTGIVGASLTVTDNHGCTSTLAQTNMVLVLPTLNTGFTADKSVLCNVTDPVQFTNTTTGPGVLTYNWDFGDGTSSTALNPSHSYTVKGNYPVKLTATSDQGCVVTYTQGNSLNVANYTTDFTVPTGVCQGSDPTFPDNSNPVATSRTWSINGSPVSYYSPFYYYFGTPGTYTVTLANVFGTCPQNVSKTVTINANPSTANFTSVVTNHCGTFDVTFTDPGPGDYTRVWYPNYYTYPAPTPSSSTGATMTNIGYAYNANYTVLLKLTNAAGCSSTISEGVYQPYYTPGISELSSGQPYSCNTPVTRSYAINYQGSTLVSYYWDFGDGTQSTAASPTHTWSNPGAYTASLHFTDTYGCTGVASAQQVIISRPFTMDISGPTTACVGSPISFTSIVLSGDAPSYVNWDYGDGNNYGTPHSYTNPGTYTISLNAQNIGGCTASATKPNYITVSAGPGTFGQHTNTCENQRDLVTFTYTGTSTTSVTWNFGDGTTTTSSGANETVTHTYPTTNTYNVSLTATNGQCSVGYSDLVHVLKKQSPVLTSSASSVCASGSLDVQLALVRNPFDIYYDATYDYSPQFFYSDGTPFTGTVGYTQYYSPYNNGAFDWTLTGFQAGKTGLYVVTTSFAAGCTDQSNTIPLIVKGGATPAFNVVADHQCYQQPVILKDASTAGANNSIASGTWNFGDGGTQALVVGGTVNHSYTNPGQYTVSLTVTDAGGCQQTSPYGTSQVVVDGPKASFSTNGPTILLGNTLYCYNNTNTYGTTSVSYVWDFGDGVTSTDISPYHLYAAPGTYVVTMTASDVGGSCSNTVKATIVVQNFNSHFQTSTNYVTMGKCPPVLAQFTNTSQGYSSVTWDFGDGSTAGNVNYPSHVYQQPGSYTVTLSIYGTGGLIAQYTDMVVVRQPSASLSSAGTSLCLGQSEAFQAASKGGKSFVFDYGDGSAASGVDSNVSHTYTIAGTYNAQVVAVDTFGCAEAANEPIAIAVHPPPTVDISPAAPVACLGSSVTLNATGGLTYSWSPATALDQPASPSPVATPVVNTSYTVSVVDDNGCTGSKSVNVQVQAPEHVSVTPDSTSICDGEKIGIKAIGTDVFAWIDTTDGLSALNIGNVIANPTTTEHYTVVGSDINSCFTDTARVIIMVLPVPTVNGGPDEEVLAGSPVQLLATGSNDVVSWSWSPPDYLSCADCAQPIASPKKPEDYVVTVTNDVGCKAKDTVVVSLICLEAKVRIPEGFTPNGDGHNDRFTILGIGEVDHLTVFDRWGQKVFETNHAYTADRNAQWDGNVGGQPMPSGVYVYFVEMTCPTGGKFMRQGTVMLVR